MVDGFVSASEVAFVVREYLRQEGFERTLSAFRDEAAHLLSAVAAGRPGRSLCCILSEFVKMKRTQAAREEAVRVAVTGNPSTDSMVERTLRSVAALLDDYALATRHKQPQESAGIQQAQSQPMPKTRSQPSQQQPRPHSSAASAVGATAAAAAAAAAGADGSARRRSASTSHQSPSKKRKSSHPRRTVVSAAVVAPRAIHWQDQIASEPGGSYAGTQPVPHDSNPLVGALATTQPNSDGTIVPITADSNLPAASPARLSTIEGETFEQIFNNDGVHTALAEVLTTRLQASAPAVDGAGTLGQATAAGSSGGLGIPTSGVAPAGEPDTISSSNSSHTGEGGSGILEEGVDGSAGSRLLPSLAVEDILRDCATAAAATQQQLQNDGSSAANDVAGSGGSGGSGSGSRSGSGWQPQKVFHAILALDAPHVEGVGSTTRGLAPAPAGAAAAAPAATAGVVARVGTTAIPSGSSSGGESGGESGSSTSSTSSTDTRRQTAATVQRPRAAGSVSKRRDLKSLLSRLDYTNSAKK